MTVRITASLARRTAVEHWQRHGTDKRALDGRVPEPAQLYSLAALVMVQHVPLPPNNRCQDCGAEWPCAPVRLAYRLREGF